MRKNNTCSLHNFFDSVQKLTTVYILKFIKYIDYNYYNI